MSKQRVKTEISDEEERAINAAIAADPDTFFASDEAWEAANGSRSTASQGRDGKETRHAGIVRGVGLNRKIRKDDAKKRA